MASRIIAELWRIRRDRSQRRQARADDREKSLRSGLLLKYPVSSDLSFGFLGGNIAPAARSVFDPGHCSRSGCGSAALAQALPKEACFHPDILKLRRESVGFENA